MTCLLAAGGVLTLALFAASAVMVGISWRRPPSDLEREIRKTHHRARRRRP